MRGYYLDTLQETKGLNAFNSQSAFKRESKKGTEKSTFPRGYT